MVKEKIKKGTNWGLPYAFLFSEKISYTITIHQATVLIQIGTWNISIYVTNIVDGTKINMVKGLFLRFTFCHFSKLKMLKFVTKCLKIKFT